MVAKCLALRAFRHCCTVFSTASQRNTSMRVTWPNLRTCASRDRCVGVCHFWRFSVDVLSSCRVVVVNCSVACRLQEILSVVVGSLLVAGMLSVNMSKIKGTSVLYGTGDGQVEMPDHWMSTQVNWRVIYTLYIRAGRYGFTLGVRAFEAWLYTFMSNKSH